MKHPCPDCGELIQPKSKRCKRCHLIGLADSRRHPLPKGYRKQVKCVDCGVIIHDRSTRCAECSGKVDISLAKEHTERRIATLTRPNMRGENHPRWAGGRSNHSAGYIRVYSKEHPEADSAGRVLEHRLVMECSIGRRLTRQEVVHHRNRNRSDNRIENLMLFPNVRAHTAWEYIEECEQRLIKEQGYQRSPHFWETLQLLLGCSSDCNIVSGETPRPQSLQGQ